MDFNKFEVIYFLGIGGIGMSALARYFNHHGKIVLGYDRTHTPLTSELEMEGIAVHYDDSTLEIPQLIKLTPKEKILVVYTPAIPRDNSERIWFETNEFLMKKRSEVLGIITNTSPTIAIAGTHGKTTTTSLTAHLFRAAQWSCNAFLGGITVNYETNLLLGELSDWTVVEADEFDRSFLTLNPKLAVITSMDADHLDIYGDASHVHEGFQMFAGKLQSGGSIVVKKGLDIGVHHLAQGTTKYEYAVDQVCDFYASNIRIENRQYTFDLHSPMGLLENIAVGLPGRHNVENAVAASAMALLAGVPLESLRVGLSSFQGVHRRFEYIIKSESFTYIDDYAHHPEELRACIQSVRELYPDKKITGIFQPHLYTRTRDFASDFSTSLSLLDEVILLPIYPARELPIEGVSSEMLMENISRDHKMVLQKNEVLPYLVQHKPEVLLTLGAGDIDMIVPAIKKQFSAE
ncbi:MAG: UDP-N-acetylmuramate--L-alanine ligase [Flavobacteriales bacterium]